MLFIENKYTQWYYRIIDQAQAQAQAADVYYEKHHIIPRSLGGSNQQDNLVRLTVRAHYVVHRLLTRMTTGDDRRKMCFAICMMANTRKGVRISSHTYQVLRAQAAEALSVLMKGKPSPLLGRPSPLLGRPSPTKGKPAHNKGKPSPLKGTKKDKPSPNKGKPSPFKGTKKDKPSPLLGRPSPNKGKPSPNKGKPSPLLGKPSPLRGTKKDKPSPLLGRPSPRKGIKETQPRKPYKPRSAEHTAKIQAAKLQKILDRPLV